MRERLKVSTTYTQVKQKKQKLFYLFGPSHALIVKGVASEL